MNVGDLVKFKWVIAVKRSTLREVTAIIIEVIDPNDRIKLFHKGKILGGTYSPELLEVVK
tara:strand:- start:658 stop:837 length:180 start_codon:yes stop_codon:yes gene_type:complete